MTLCFPWTDRSTSPTTEQLNRAELEALRVKLEAMPRHELETFYKARHNPYRYFHAVAVAVADSGTRSGVDGVAEAGLE